MRIGCQFWEFGTGCQFWHIWYHKSEIWEMRWNVVLEEDWNKCLGQESCHNRMTKVHFSNDPFILPGSSPHVDSTLLLQTRISMCVLVIDTLRPNLSWVRDRWKRSRAKGERGKQWRSWEITTSWKLIFFFCRLPTLLKDQQLDACYWGIKTFS